MIHVCSLARLDDTVEDTGASHVVTLLRDIDLIARLPPKGVDRKNHLIVRIDDVTCPLDGYTHPGEEHLQQLLDFVREWDRAAPLVLHCYAGISRSTAMAGWSPPSRASDAASRHSKVNRSASISSEARNGCGMDSVELTPIEI